MYKKSVLIVLLMLSVLLSACNFPLAFDDTAEVENAVAETIAAIEEAEAEPKVVVPTLVLAPTSTPMLTEEPEDADEAEDVDADEAEDEVEAPICLSAQAWDLTVPDDTKMAAGAKIDKAWTFKNVGYCPWTSDFKIVFDGGDQMSGPDFKEIGVEVAYN